MFSENVPGSEYVNLPANSIMILIIKKLKIMDSI
jgi:hypothetical protein